MPSSSWRNIFKDSCQPISQFLLFPLCALTSVCLSPASPTEGGLSVHSSLPSLLPQAFSHLTVCFATTVLRVYSVSPSSSLPPSIPLSHAPWSIWTRREKGDLSVKAAGGKWRLRWRRHALYIKCPDPCERRRRVWGGDISIGFCLKRDKAKTAMRDVEWSRGRGVERKRDQKKLIWSWAVRWMKR